MIVMDLEINLGNCICVEDMFNCVLEYVVMWILIMGKCVEKG